MDKLRFIDINSSNVFDGSQPYVFWFDGGQSVNLQYVKQICFISKKQNVKASINSEDAPIFTLLDVTKINTNKSLANLDINTLRTQSLTSTGWDYEGEGYVHMIYINASSPDVGEFIGGFVIDGEQYSIGADFYMEDERLLDNLHNFGVEIPPYVQRAIYENNLHEPAIDNILMNRKWKELLLEYMNIIVNKGSYNSLVNSLKWFEWGDLLRLQEYWRYTNYDKEWLRAYDLMKITSEEIQHELKNYAKTTYIGLFAALDKLKRYDGEIEHEDHFNANEGTLENYSNPDMRSAFTNGSLNNETNPEYRILQIGGYDDTNRYNYISDENETYKEEGVKGAWFRRVKNPGVHIVDEANPKLEKVSFIWGFRDLALKMSLLGNYFSTYFMPIHLDLINASLENRVFTNTVKILSAADLHRCDLVDQTTGIWCNMEDDAVCYLRDVKTYTYPDTPFSKQYTGGNWDEYSEDRNITAVGVDLEAGKKADLKTYIANLYGGIGAIVPIEFRIDNVGNNRFVIKSILYDNDSTHVIENDNIYVPEDGKDIHISANILLKTEGPHQLRFEFITNSGEILIKTLRINVVDKSWQPMELYKVKRLDYNTLHETADSIYNIFTTNDFVYSQQDKSNKFNTGGTFELSKYSQFLPYTCNPLRNSFGVNHMIKINLDEVDTVLCNDRPTRVEGENDGLVQMLARNGYRYEIYNESETSPSTKYLLAINPTFHNRETRIDIYSGEVTIYGGGKITTSITQTIPNIININFEGVDVNDLDIMCTVKETGRRIYPNLQGSLLCTLDLTSSLNILKTKDISIHIDIVYKRDGYKYHIMNEDLYIQNIISEEELQINEFDIKTATRDKEEFVISEGRIFPLFHTLEKLEGNMEINDDELVAVVPNIPMTLKNKDITAAWTFINESTGKQIKFKPKHYEVSEETFEAISETLEDDLPVNQPIIYTIGDHTEKGTPLPRGYYSIKLEYSMGGEVINTTTLKHAFHKI